LLFTSITFLFYFLPLLLLGYFLVHKNIKVSNAVLLAGSLVFYAWGEPVFVLIMLLSIVMNYSIGLLIDRYRNTGSYILMAGVFLNLSVLCYFKYLSFILSSIATFFSLSINIPDVALPLGISFFTFQAITYLVDLNKKEIKVQRNMFDLALYISLFPQLIAGPIVRYADIETQIHNRTHSWLGFSDGIRRFLIGFGKKVLIANTFAQVADEIFALPESELTTYIVLIGVLAYTLQIYFDFSAYSDMAIGLAKMFGFDLKENFNYPYISRSIKEFWRRWHISLSTFLRDYLYIPLGGNRDGIFATYRNLLIVFFLCGLWHGAGWTFIIWGLYFGFFLVLERLFLEIYLVKIPKALSWIYMAIVVMFGWLIFRSDNLEQLFMMLNGMVNFEVTQLLYKYLQDRFLIVTFVLALLGSTPLIRDYFINTSKPIVMIARDIFLMATFIISIAFLAAGTYNPFIYFRF